MRIALAAIATLSLSGAATLRAADVAAKEGITEPKTEAKTESTEKKAGSLGAMDTKFVKKAAKGGMMEVSMGEMAEKQGESKDVKKLGEKLETDHAKANKELMELAEKKGVTLPAKKDDKMGAWKSDKEYLAMMEKDHEKDIAEFEKEAKSGEDADVKAWAEKTLPTLKEHLSMVKEAMAKVK